MPSSSGVIAQQQRTAQTYSDDADAGPLLPKTVVSSAHLPRIGHSRNNSSASASAAPASALPGAGSDPAPKRHSAQDGQAAVGLGGEGPRPGHRRAASYGEARQRKAKGLDGGAAAETSTSASGVAVLAAKVAGTAAATAAAGQAASITAAGRPGAVHSPVQDEDDDFCPTCLEAYTLENPKIFTECGHHFHMPCIYAWLERKDTCPMCESPMQAPGM